MQSLPYACLTLLVLVAMAGCSQPMPSSPSPDGRSEFRLGVTTVGAEERVKIEIRGPEASPVTVVTPFVHGQVETEFVIANWEANDRIAARRRDPMSKEPVFTLQRQSDGTWKGSSEAASR